MGGRFRSAPPPVSGIIAPKAKTLACFLARVTAGAPCSGMAVSTRSFVPYRRVHAVAVPEHKPQEALDWTWRYANILHRGYPWIKTGLRSAKVGGVYLIFIQ
jgi:hypothetical protein